jgi:curved DNA-binding protein CbpA
MEGQPLRQNYYQDLGISPAASRKEVERAFWVRQRQCRSGIGGADLRRRIEEAYLTLSNPPRRRDYDRRLGCRLHPAWESGSRETARVMFRNAMVMLEGGREERALASLRRAVRLDRGKALYLSYLALLTARRGGALGEAVRYGQEALERAPGDREIALNMAAILETAGMNRRARRIRRQHRRGLLSRLHGGT